MYGFWPSSRIVSVFKFRERVTPTSNMTDIISSDRPVISYSEWLARELAVVKTMLGITL